MPSVLARKRKSISHHLYKKCWKYTKEPYWHLMLLLSHMNKAYQPLLKTGKSLWLYKTNVRKMYKVIIVLLQYFTKAYTLLSYINFHIFLRSNNLANPEKKIKKTNITFIFKLKRKFTEGKKIQEASKLHLLSKPKCSQFQPQTVSKLHLLGIIQIPFQWILMPIKLMT